MGRIFVTGDTHGDQSVFFDKRLAPGGMLKKGDVLIVCGDFGFIFLNTPSEKAFIKDLEALPYTILFVCGNHENFDALYEYPIVELFGGKVHKISENIFHLMRGEIYTDVNGKSIFAMGGAYSIDKYRRSEGYSWWPQEQPNDEEYRNAINNLKKHHNEVDLIITHTMPQKMIWRYGKYPEPHDMQLTGFFDWIYEDVKFNHWYCGHWHDDMDLTEDFTMLYREIRAV